MLKMRGWAQRYQPAHAVHNRAARAQGLDGEGLKGAGAGLESIAVHHLQPGEPHGQTPQGGAEEQVDGEETAGGERLKIHDPVIASAPALATRTSTRTQGASLLPTGSTRRMAARGGGTHQ
jgi:hypothetical protein